MADAIAVSADHGESQLPRASNLVPGLVASLALVGMFLASLQSRGTSAREELLAFVERVEAREAVERVPVLREASLIGPLEDGVANTCYAAAIADFQRCSEPFRESKLRLDDLTLPLQEVTALRAAWQPAIDSLLRGARCRTLLLDAPRPLDWPPVAMIGFECACRVQESRQGESVVLWSAAAQMLADQRRIAWNFGFMTGCWSHVSSLLRVWSDARLQRLGPADLTMLATAVEALADSYARPIDFERLVAEAARNVTSADYYDGMLFGRPDVLAHLRAWRTGFSVQQESICRVHGYVQGLAELRSAEPSWPRRQADFARFALTALEGIAEEFRGMERNHRRALVELRLLRMAIAFHLGEPLEQLLDPLGDGPLVVDDRGATIVIRSAGDVQRILTR